MFAILLSNVLSRSYSKSFSKGFGNFGRRHVLVFHVLLLSALGLGHLEFLVWGFWFCFLFLGLFCFVFVFVQAPFFFLWLCLQCSGEEAVIVGLRCYFPLWDQHSGPQVLTWSPPWESATVCNNSYQCQPCYHCSWWPPCDWMPYPSSGQHALCFCCFDLKLWAP